MMQHRWLKRNSVLAVSFLIHNSSIEDDDVWEGYAEDAALQSISSLATTHGYKISHVRIFRFGSADKTLRVTLLMELGAPTSECVSLPPEEKPIPTSSNGKRVTGWKYWPSWDLTRKKKAAVRTTVWGSSIRGYVKNLADHSQTKTLVLHEPGFLALYPELMAHMQASGQDGRWATSLAKVIPWIADDDFMVCELERRGIDGVRSFPLQNPSGSAADSCGYPLAPPTSVDRVEMLAIVDFVAADAWRSRWMDYVQLWMTQLRLDGKAHVLFLMLAVTSHSASAQAQELRDLLVELLGIARDAGIHLHVDKAGILDSGGMFAGLMVSESALPGSRLLPKHVNLLEELPQ